MLVFYQNGLTDWSRYWHGGIYLCIWYWHRRYTSTYPRLHYTGIRLSSKI